MIRSTGQNSAELHRSYFTYLAPTEKIRCLHDNIVVEPLDLEQSKIMSVIEHTKPMRGIVKAVGPGHYPKRYNHPDKHRRTKMWNSKQFQPTEIKVGDIVDLGGYNYRGYSFQQFMWGSKLHILAREADVCAVVETSNGSNQCTS